MKRSILRIAASMPLVFQVGYDMCIGLVGRILRLSGAIGQKGAVELF